MHLKACLFNDTSDENHHGCNLVVNNLLSGLSRNNISVTKRFPTRCKFWKNRDLSRTLNEFDLIIINGEGTLHDESNYGERLLQIVNLTNRPTYLINSSYYNNPPEWAAYLTKFRAIFTRDSQSANDISRLIGKEVPWMPDLSLLKPFSPQPTANRQGTICGDSVIDDITEQLMAWSQADNTDFLPIMSSPIRIIPGRTGLKRRINVSTSTISRLIANRLSGQGNYKKQHADYIDAISKSSQHITGRFHGVCISLMTRTPFLGIESNIPKISRMLDDIGLGQERILTEISKTTIYGDVAFSVDELAMINAYIEKARSQFDQFVTIAHQG
ncbi:polysaccharide pyruvyl transferase family protein [Cohaesibacter celericrescens]|uniref:Polysaccharide pyruvyl transferase domain-containing protein n=1 Tax=Cohaesibacter celericrescens TaxID=2067669 RepID=A0A2N5XWV9_9HYPH|nr:polysaccharide pyruvyl transferase family protein [Cohaesibacter celericrescens]PLW78993.1 hypothetical protein C0081_01790 [Cohaesibacter celericrescens]